MKKLLLLCFILSQYVSQATSAAVDPTIVEISDSTLSVLNYDGTSYAGPTKLVFTNLTSVSGDVNFINTSNLVEVEFPKLESVSGDVTFYSNTDLVTVSFPVLKSINKATFINLNQKLVTFDMPNLTTTNSIFSVDNNSRLETLNTPLLSKVSGFLKITNNPSLSELTLCNLNEITFQNVASYYTIENNNVTVDATPFCFESESFIDIVLSGSTIVENSDIGTVIGELSVTPVVAGEVISYSLIGTSDFTLDGNKLISARPFDFESKSTYLVKVEARNQLTKSVIKTFEISIENVVDEPITIIEITDATLDEVTYQSTVYTSPTQLVFTNLTHVSGDINFLNTINLIDVSFPKLTTVGGKVNFYQNQNITKANLPVLENIGSSFTFNENLKLSTIDFPLLTSTGGLVFVDNNVDLENLNLQELTNVTTSLTIKRNTLLNELTLCKLKEIQSTGLNSFYSIENNNTTVDATPFCFESDVQDPANLSLSNGTIQENKPEGTVIGELSTDSNNDSYTIVNTNGSFKLEGNQLVSNQVFDFETKISYSVTIKASNISGASIEKEFEITIEDINDELGIESFETNQIAVSPNPSKGLFIIELGNKTDVEIRVSDNNGRIIKQEQFIGLSTLDIDISNHASGLYIVQIISGSNVVVKKLIKK